MICPRCKINKRKLINELAMELNETINVIKSEKSVCKECLEEHFWDCYFKAKQEQLRKTENPPI